MTYDEIVNLGNLVNITVTESESHDLIPKIDSILGYIDQIKSIDVEMYDQHVNGVNPTLRSDIVNDDTSFSLDFIDGVPNKQSGYVKVTKVLGVE